MIIPFLAAATVLGLVVVVSARWRRRSFDQIPSLPRKPWLLLFALLPQIIWTHWLSHLGSAANGFSWILPLSYAPVIWFIVLNVRFAWARVIAVGVALNLAVMVTNGGTMPAPARFATSQPAVMGVETERLAPGSKDRIVSDQTPALLAPLQDQYVVTLPGGMQRLASIGDFVSLGGAMLGLFSIL